MKINLQASNMELTPAIEQYFSAKILSEVQKFHVPIIKIDAEVEKTTHHHAKGQVFRAEVNIHTAGKLVRAEVTHEDLYAAIDKLKDTVFREIRDLKDREDASRKKNGRMARFAKSIFFWRGEKE